MYVLYDPVWHLNMETVLVLFVRLGIVTLVVKREY